MLVTILVVLAVLFIAGVLVQAATDSQRDGYYKSYWRRARKEANAARRN